MLFKLLGRRLMLLTTPHGPGLAGTRKLDAGINLKPTAMLGIACVEES